MRWRSGASMGMRRLKAVAVVLAVLVAAPGIDVLVNVVAPSRVAGAADEGLDAGLLLAGGDASAALDRIEDAADSDGAGVPDWYEEEVGFLPGVRDVRSNDMGTVVGYVVAGDCDDVLAKLIEHMQLRGWRSVPLGGVTGATFVKEGGSCTWSLVTCAQVGSDTSVVARCAHA